MDKVDAYVDTLVIPWATHTCVTIEDLYWDTEYEWTYFHDTKELTVYDIDYYGVRYTLFKGSPQDCRVELETNLGEMEPVECVFHAWIRKGCPPLGSQRLQDRYNRHLAYLYRTQAATALFKDELLFRTEKRKALQGSAELLQKILTNNMRLQSVELQQVVPLVY